MIPRLKAAIDYLEAKALFQFQPIGVEDFEFAFADTFVSKEAIAFPYGRSALWALFNALGFKNNEIIMPAYTCSVVAHAIILSGNIPQFVDINLEDYNMSLEQVKDSITSQTRAIVATHLFGYPLDVEALNSIVSEAEVKFGHKIWVIQDCAHSFGAEWRGTPVNKSPDIGLFGLNISKTITSIFGGMLTTDNQQLAQEVRRWRNDHFSAPSILKGLQRRLYLLASIIAFNPTVYELVYRLQEETSLLKPLTDAYHLDEKIHFPPDAYDQMLPVEARIGIIQLSKYHHIIQHRRNTARDYNNNLRPYEEKIGFLPPIVEGATYSHYVIRVEDRVAWLKAAAKHGIQLGKLIEYSMPEMNTYRSYITQDFPNARLAMNSMINLPIHFSITDSQKAKIIDFVKNYAIQ